MLCMSSSYIKFFKLKRLFLLVMIGLGYICTLTQFINWHKPLLNYSKFSVDYFTVFIDLYGIGAW